MSKSETRNYNLCFFCLEKTNTIKELSKFGVKIEDFEGEKCFFASNATMGCGPSSIGTWIKHDGKDKLWCSKCTVPEIIPECGAPGCVSCKPGQLHYCDRCEVRGATHRARNCPCPKKR